MIMFESASLPHSASERALPLLSVERVTKDYQTDGESVRALNDVTLQIEQASFVALVGRSGCGKSTLLHLAGAMDFPTSGHVRLDGVATDQLNEAQLTTLRREKVGFIFQSFQLLHTLSVVENVELPLLLAGQTHPRPRALDRLASGGARGAGAAHAASTFRRPDAAGGHCPGAGPLATHSACGRTHRKSGLGNRDSDPRIAAGDLQEQKTAILMATHSTEAAAFVDTTIRMRDGRIVA